MVEQSWLSLNTWHNGGTELAFLEYLAVTAVNRVGLLQNRDDWEQSRFPMNVRDYDSSKYEMLLGFYDSVTASEIKLML